MTFVKLSKNVLVNPRCISCIEQTISRGQPKIYVYVEGKKYELEEQLSRFMSDLDKVPEPNPQHWVG